MEQQEVYAIEKPEAESAAVNLPHDDGGTAVNLLDVVCTPANRLPIYMLEYERLSAYVAPYLARLDELKALIIQDVKAHGATFEHGAVKAVYKPAYKRSSWDSRGLSAYARNHPEVAEFWRETEVAASVSIKIGLE